MKRSLWKGPFIDYNLFKELKSKNIVKTNSRNSTILPFMINKIIYIHNGKNYVPIKIKPQMIGYKLGYFVLTRLRHVYKKVSRQIKKKK